MITIKRSEDKNEYQIDQFNGPLDLLLELIKKNEINIYDIPISKITDEYINFIENNKTDLDDLTDFYKMAATLLLIKSKMMLPVEADFEDEYEDPRSELIEKLIEYQKYKKLTDMMQEKNIESEWLIERKKKQRMLPFENSDDIWENLDVVDLLNTFSNLVKQLPVQLIDTDEIKVEQKISLIEEKLSRNEEFYFTDLIVSKNSAMEVICAFLAILNLVKEKSISLFQNKMFGDIKITKYKVKNLEVNEEEEVNVK